MKKYIFPLVIVFILILSIVPKTLMAAAAITSILGCSDSNAKSQTLSLDGVDLLLCNTIFSSPNIETSDTLDNNQVISISTHKPFKNLMVTTIPFGRGYSYDKLSFANANSVDQYNQMLNTNYQKTGAIILTGPEISIFNKSIVSTEYIYSDYVGSPDKVPVITFLWITSSKDRIWLVKYTAQISNLNINDFDNNIISKEASSIKILSTDPDQQSLSSSIINSYIQNKFNKFRASQETNVTLSSLTTVTTVPWWNPTNYNSCDYTFYNAQVPISVTASALTGSFMGVQACGPGPDWTSSSGKNVLRSFDPNNPSGAGAYEWYCVEYSMRFMKLMYNISPYHLTDDKASNIVANYSGSTLEKRYPSDHLFPRPGDILAITGGTFGHTSVVSAISILNSTSGNADITVVEENSSTTGSKTIQIRGWYGGNIIGWLHDPSGDICTLPSTGDWVLSSNTICVINNAQTFSNNIFINDTSSLTIDNTGNLNFDFTNKKIVIQSTAKLIVKSGGKIY